LKNYKGQQKPILFASKAKSGAQTWQVYISVHVLQGEGQVSQIFVMGLAKYFAGQAPRH